MATVALWHKWILYSGPSLVRRSVAGGTISTGIRASDGVYLASLVY